MTYCRETKQHRDGLMVCTLEAGHGDECVFWLAKRRLWPSFATPERQATIAELRAAMQRKVD